MAVGVIDVVPVLMDERVGDIECLTGRDDDACATATAAVTAFRAGPAMPRYARARNDPDRDVRDLGTMRGPAQQSRVPLGVDVLGTNVEVDRASLVVLARHRRGASRSGHRERGDRAGKRDSAP